eukprot:13560_1
MARKRKVIISRIIIIFAVAIIAFMMYLELRLSNKTNIKILPSNAILPNKRNHIIHTHQPLCDIYWNTTFFGSHHKSGTVLLNFFLRRQIEKYISSKCILNTNVNILYSHWLSLKTINDFIHNSLNNITKQHIKIINIIRNPLDSVLSGYNYHLWSKEKWLHKTITNMYDSSVAVLSYQERKHIPYKTLALKNFCHSTLFLELLNSNNIPNNISINQLYNTMNISVGVSFEYMRYKKCEFDFEIYPSYRRIMELEYINDEYIHVANFRLENFATNYNESVLGLLDVIGIWKETHRQNLLRIFAKGDINSINSKNSTPGHSTRGTFDKSEQTDALLQDMNRCLQLKNMTLLLDYKWKYRKYC